MAGRPEPWVNVAISGTSLTVLATTLGARGQVARAYRDVTVVLTGASSDLGNEGDTAAQAFADLEAVVAGWRALGADRVIVATVPPAAFITAGEETARLELNALIRTDGFDGVLDLAAAPELDDSADLTYYQADQIHLTPAGAAVAAALLEPLLDELLGV
jgi:lysophospholipase L1-like esterase